ncbi:MAG: carbonic anhydrase family protein [Methylovulum sp.]|uniref:bifunctional SulP family inorganic anion transporter/carbonic anhydrase n=1 Tax=Methylovulum sp. TaxID=1916980 RepID=UPI00261CD7C0|nr:carbonic anhydrase family protein [Methylovulum sp.]MDD2723574.1 carbonic anhydrase family protein [Methylovulum sp.]MDD5124160.1 carbonic anhydrase family protein [Methylovulum sp.]
MLDKHRATFNGNVFANLKDDVPAGVAVFLVAVPLSLGIALASGAPLFSGLITGIIGGMVVAPLSGSALGISGAATGLAVMVLSSIQDLGFHAFLLAVILAGCLQILMGVIRAGVISYYFPSSVINGMLSGIGIILFLKQIPHALGYDRDFEGDFRFVQSDNYSSFSELLHMLEFTSPTAMFIAFISLVILIAWELPFIKRHRFFQLFPGVLASVIAAVAINQILLEHSPELALSGGHLVILPIMDSMQDFIKQLNAPDFGAITQPKVYLVAFTLAIVASLETLIATEAIDKLDSYKRTTPANRELIVQGIGNISAGLMGGLPMTQVIVRSSFNLQSGAKTQASAFLHGLLLLLTVILIPELLHKIPLACLAAILIVVAYKMARPQIFKNMYRAGVYHFIPFWATILGMVLTDILLGLAIGLSTALISILLENYKSSLYFQEMRIGNKIILRLSEHVSFLNKANIQQTFQDLPAYSQVVIDATRSKYIDYDVYEMIENFRQEAPLRHIELTLQNLRGYGPLPPVTNARPQTLDSQQSLTPAKVLEILKEGNEHFVNNLESNRNLLEQVNDTRQGQFPIAIILSCMDSRTSVELIFDQGLGDIFSARVAGNIINDDILGSMEFACKISGSKLIVVLGHSHCGAIKGACNHVQLDHLTGLLEKIQPAVAAVQAETGCDITADDYGLVQLVADKNVLLTVEHIKTRSPLLNGMLESGEIGIVGGMYDIETGKVRFYSDIASVSDVQSGQSQPSGPPQTQE